MLRLLKRQKLQRILGCCLIVVGIGLGWVWFCRFQPVIERADPAWAERFSQKTYWKELQQHIRDHGWKHDDFVIVGNYGDKAWAEWIMAKAQAGAEIGECGEVGHKDAALNYITCQNPAGKTNWNTTSCWLGWWKTNAQKSQIEWIRDGLNAYGVQLELPPSTKDFQPLLELLGKDSTNELERVPAFVKYNAFRWLRSSDFNCTFFALSNVNAQTPDLVRLGVINFSKYEKAWPKADGIGLLEFDPDKTEAPSSGFSYTDSRRIQFAAYLLIGLPIVAGVCLLAWSRRQPKQLQPQPTPRAGA